MILFIYGKDNFRSLQKLNAIKDKFIDASLGDTNLSIVDFTEEKINFNDLWQMILTPPFLAKKRLIIIRNLLLTKNKKIQEEIEQKISKIPENSLVVFYEDGVPDKRSSLFKKLNKPKNSQNFELLEHNDLIIWTQKEFEKNQVSIDRFSLEKLVSLTGPDLWRLFSEINKLSSYGKKITVKEIDLLVKSNTQTNIFALIDFLQQKDTKKACSELEKILNSGENEIYILTMIVYGMRNLVIVKDMLEKKLSISQIQTNSGIHPFALRKIINCADNFSQQQIKNIYSQLAEYDFYIKSGKIEPKIALSLLVLKITDNL